MNWKRAERVVCRKQGAERRGPTGRELSDCTDDAVFATEVKRVKRPQLPSTWIEQAKKHGKREKKPWLIVQVIPGSPKQLATLDYDFLLQLVGERELARQMERGLIAAYETKNPAADDSGLD